jgi:hypothetical protein
MDVGPRLRELFADIVARGVLSGRGRTIVIVAVLASAPAAGGCGDGGQATRPAPQPPTVARQVHDALQGTLDQAAPGLPSGRPRLPFVAVGSCTGPAAGGPGSYRCATTPRGARGVRAISVDGRADGTWASEQFRVVTTLHGRRTPGRSAVWGTGIRLPR